MKSVRLPRDLERKLKMTASREGISESQVIREALEEYMAEKKDITPYEAGKELFGMVGSGSPDRSASYKSELKKKLREKKASY